MWMRLVLLGACLVSTLAEANEPRLAYVDAFCDPYYVGRDFPKLTTPQWVGEEGVEAVVVLAIDDMRDTARYEAYLRPILDRLKQIDGRAPVSIMTCSVDPNDPRLRTWVEEGLSIDVHTVDHPCPLLNGGDFARAKSTYDRCVDLLSRIPGNEPVAFRMPCCDSLNTPSPRFWMEIFNKTTEQGHYLQIDTSVFNITTPNDPDLPRELVFDEDGGERFRKYLPFPSFVNTIEDYPYPYIIGGTCWEFPCIVPSDWEAQNLHQPNNPKTVEDMKAALDAVVIKQGTYNLVFHPHGWIRNDQIVELIDHAVAKHGKKVKFLTFREAIERINKNLLNGKPLRAADGGDNGVRLWDVDNDGLLDVVDVGRVRKLAELPADLPQGVTLLNEEGRDAGLRLVDVNEDGHDDVIFSNGERYSLHLWSNDDSAWSIKVIEGTRGQDGGVGPVIPPILRADGTNNGTWFHSRHMWVQNEDTNRLPDLVARLSFDDMLADYHRQRDEAGEMPPPKSPEQSLKAMRLAPGFTIDLVAAEPLVEDPVAFDWGPDGRLWVVEMRDYPNGIDWHGPGDPLGNPGGRVKVLTDDDGDGRYDRSSIFLDKLPFPTGVKVWRDGIIVSGAPDVFFAKDTDGDDVADERETLYSGFGEGNQQHRVNGLRWGLDNWLYLANGDSGGSIKSEKTGEVVDIRGRDLRIRPDDGSIEAIEGQTQFGRNRDDWGNWFGGNNSNPMWHYVLSDHYVRRNPHYAPNSMRRDVPKQAGAAPVFPASRTLARFNDFDRADRFTSACSPMVYRDELFHRARGSRANEQDATGDNSHASRVPHEFVFICEPVHNLVHREVMTPTDSSTQVTFRSERLPHEQGSEFLASTDNWFRPVMARTGPDGALWIADMYRMVIEHPEWIPADWQDRLDLRNGDDRGRIYRVFPVGGPPRIPTRLDQLDTEQLVAALDSPNGWQRDMVQQMLLWRGDHAAVAPLTRLASAAERPTTRLHALCTLDGLGKLDATAIVQAMKDTHPGVRRHAIRVSESHLNESPALVNQLYAMVHDPDAFVRHQLAYSLGEVDDPNVGLRLASLDHEYAALYLSSAVMSSVKKNNLRSTLGGFLLVGAPPSLMIERLLSVAAALNATEELNGALKSTLNRPTPESVQRLRKRRMLTTLREVIQRQGQQLDDLLDDDALQAVSRVDAEARQLATDESTRESERRHCIRFLGHGATDTDRAMFSTFLTPQMPAETQAAAVDALVSSQHHDVPERLLSGWKSHSPALRTQILDDLLARPQWAVQLLDRLDGEDATVVHLDARRRQQLFQHRDESIRERAAKLFAVTQSDRQAVVDRYASVASLKADATRGKIVFGKQCSACHRLDDVGHEVGPQLKALTNKSHSTLLVSILDPNRAIEDKFLAYAAVTNDGRQFTGVISNESANAITLTAADGKQHQLLRSNLDEFVSTGKSLMPEGMEKELPPQDMADVIAYLRSSAAPPKEFPGNNPQVAPVNDDGEIELLATHARIYGPSLLFEQRYKNLGFWRRAEDHAIWLMPVPAGGAYRVMIDYACDNGTAGNAFVFTVGSQEIRGTVEGTGTWDDYRTHEIGRVILSPFQIPGPIEATFRSDGPMRGYLIDLRGIRLVPDRE